jgi:methylenetetrahydrofolate reductase (NADPH)
MLLDLIKGRHPKETPFLCMEVNPPRGVDAEPVIKRLSAYVEKIDLLNITDSALARMKCAALPFASLVKSRLGVEPLVNFACRDRNLIAIQADLLAAWMLGVRSVIALTGDAVKIGDMPECKGVFEVNSIGLLNTIATLNGGHDLAGNELKGSPAYIPGVVVNPNARNPKAEIKRLQKKKEAGALYALSQPVFDCESSVAFFQEAQEVGIPLLIGLLPFRSAQAARNIASVPGIRLSDAVEEMIRTSDEVDLSEASIQFCVEIARLNRGYVAGFHVISGVSPKLGLSLIDELYRTFCVPKKNIDTAASESGDSRVVL